MKKISSLLLYVLMILSVCTSAYATADPVSDKAGLLTNVEVDRLNAKAKEISAKYFFTICILTVDSLDGKYPQQYADDYYDEFLLGRTNGNGILLVVAMANRRWAVTTNGDTVSVITDSDIDELMVEVQDLLSDGSYYEAFDQFLTEIENEYTAKAWEPRIRVFVSLIIGAIAAGITLLIMRSGMKTAKQQHGAGSYMVESSYDLFQCRDIFLYSRTTKVRKPDNNSSGGRSRSGGSRGGRSGRF